MLGLPLHSKFWENTLNPEALTLLGLIDWLTNNLGMMCDNGQPFLLRENGEKMPLKFDHGLAYFDDDVLEPLIENLVMIIIN